jgi:hypothetical protein
VSSFLCQASTCFRIGSKFLCIRSTSTETQSISENDFECLASTGVNTPEIMFLIVNTTRFNGPNFLEIDAGNSWRPQSAVQSHG